MARRARHFISGATYHVMFRGNNGQSIFSSDAQRCHFCLLMQEGVERYGHSILSFCFMTNHVHLAIQLNDVPLSKICQNLAFRYARFYNRQHDTRGHLFQGRFNSVLVDSESYLKELVRYIHLNPVRAKMIDDPLNYEWSSHQAYLLKKEFTWLSLGPVLKLFGESHLESLEQFHQFVMSGIGRECEIDFKKGISGGVVGDEMFIEKMRTREEIVNSRQNRLHSMDLKTLVTTVTDTYGIDVKILQTPGIERRPSHIRALTALMARDVVGVNLRELADFFCRTDSSMSHAAARMESRMHTSNSLKIEVENIKAKLLLAMR